MLDDYEPDYENIEDTTPIDNLQDEEERFVIETDDVVLVNVENEDDFKTIRILPINGKMPEFAATLIGHYVGDIIDLEEKNTEFIK